MEGSMLEAWLEARSWYGHLWKQGHSIGSMLEARLEAGSWMGHG